MDKKDFKHLLDAYLQGRLSEQEAAKLEQWLDAMADGAAFDALSEQERTAARDAGYRQLLARIGSSSVPAPRRIGLPGAKLLKIAAAVALLVMISLLFRNRLLDIIAPHRQTYVSSSAGQIKKQILSDGTIVWLKGDSKLVFPAAFGSGDRAVTLEGEALFEVAKDAAHPFLIYCGTLTTRVLGTSFNIRHNGTATEVEVLTGKVALTTAQSEKILLYPNQKAVYSEPGATIAKDSSSGSQVSALTRGTEYDMAFNDATMREVIQRIEKKFEVRISVEDSAIHNNLITADLTDQSLQSTIEIISQTLNLEADIKGKTVLLQPKRRT